MRRPFPSSNIILALIWDLISLAIVDRILRRLFLVFLKYAYSLIPEYTMPSPSSRCDVIWGTQTRVIYVPKCLPKPVKILKVELLTKGCSQNLGNLRDGISHRFFAFTDESVNCAQKAFGASLYECPWQCVRVSTPLCASAGRWIYLTYIVVMFAF